MENKKCKHDGGWVSVKKQDIFVDKNKETKFGRETDCFQVVLCRCNTRECNARRNLYFAEDGKFIRFGKMITKDVDYTEGVKDE